MKKSFLTFAVALAAMATMSCSNNSAEGNAEGTDSTATEQTAEGETAATDPFPWDFPQNVKLDAEPGQLALAPYTFYPGALEKGEDLTTTTLIFYKSELQEVGETTSKMGGKDIPNALIIPLDKDAKAKKGDILLTWWQSGSGLERAIVRDASNPAEPKVDYLDLNYSDDPDHPGAGQNHANEQLKPGSFTVLNDGEWQPGAQIACKKGDSWRIATLIRVEGDKVLAYAFGARVEAYNKADVKIVPFKENIKVGDMVWGKFAATYKPDYKVTKVDNELGRVWVEHNNHTEILSICEVTKVLE
ncbi:MAG: hypothetical protein IJ775_02100 [Muribaculaceae bacterium]|nr:hypothetical protein [Muribaculaceae bacterium]